MAKILGVNVFHGDSAAAVIDKGQMEAAVEEERFTRVKHWAGFPEHSIRYCMSKVGAEKLEDLDAIAVSRKPDAYVIEKALLALRNPGSLVRAASRVKNLVQVSSLESHFNNALPGEVKEKVRPVEHHLAHVASSFFASPFEEAACLTVDGFGDFVSTMLAHGKGNDIKVLDRVHFPHSMGLFYTAVTQFLGFPKYGDEYKVMGLAAYGEPRFKDVLLKVVPETKNGLFQLDLKYFKHLSEGVDMTWEGGEPKLGKVYTDALADILGPERNKEDDVEQRHKDIAASVQAVYEERFFALVREVIKRTGCKKLALAGGCGMNSLANGRLFDNTDIEDVYIQAAAGDAGTALGAALYVNHVEMGNPRELHMDHCYWGPDFGEGAVREAIAAGIPGSDGFDGTHGEFVVETIKNEDELCKRTAEAIADGQVVGWYQGRSEWGPRALGNRSIVADPRRGDMRDILNAKIKRREMFRPFAPSIMEEHVSEWFTLSYPDPFMIKVYPIRLDKRSEIPAVTHVDGTGRLQSVSRTQNPRYWKLIDAFRAKSGVPIVLNTSFNENEPIVNTPAEALACFLRTKMDLIVLGDTLVRRREDS